MRKTSSLATLATVAAVAFAGAQAHTNDGVGIGVPMPLVAAPVYAHAPAYPSPPVVVASQPVVVAPGYYDDWRLGPPIVPCS